MPKAKVLALLAEIKAELERQAEEDIETPEGFLEGVQSFYTVMLSRIEGDVG